MFTDAAVALIMLKVPPSATSALTRFHGVVIGRPSQVVSLELNATQRLIQALTGRSLVLFRPPYLGDAAPGKENAGRATYQIVETRAGA